MTVGIDRSRVRGFTLVEVVISIFIMSVISAAVMTAFLFFTKSGFRVASYVDLNDQARKALETFGSDCRMARSLTWTSNTDVTFVVPVNASGGTYTVHYRWLDNTYSTASLRETFSRQVTASADTSIMPTDSQFQPLVSGVKSFVFSRYRLNSPTSPSSTAPQATNEIDTKQINVQMTAERSTTLVAKSTNVVLSARYVLRNKVVAN